MRRVRSIIGLVALAATAGAGTTARAQGQGCYAGCFCDFEFIPGGSSLPSGQVGSPWAASICVQLCDAPFLYWVVDYSPPWTTSYEQAGCGNGGPDLWFEGIPTAPGTQYIQATVYSNCASCTATYDFYIAPPACPLTVTGTPGPGQVGTPYSATFGAAGGTPPYTFSVAGGTLPPGLSLSSSGILSGTPTAPGAFTFDVLAQDGQGCVGARSFTVTVDCFITVAGNLEIGQVGVAYTSSVTASGGTPPYAYRLYSGTLPPGLSLSPGGVLSGSPSARGAYRFSIEAQDSTACVGHDPFSLGVRGKLDLVPGMGFGYPNENRARIVTTAGGVVMDVIPYAAGHWGVEATGADIQGGLLDRFVTGPGPGATLGPQVRGFDRLGASMAKVNFYAYGTLKYGVHPGGADVDGDGYDEILTGAGAGQIFGPHVRGFDVDAGALAAMAGLNYFAYGTSQWGVHVGGGYVVPGNERIVTGPGPGAGFGPTVRTWLFTGPSTQPEATFTAFSVASYGVRVATGTVTGQAFEAVLVGRGPGPGQPARLRGFLVSGTGAWALPGFDVVAFLSAYGAAPGSGDLDGDRRDELICGSGPDPSHGASIEGYRYAGSSLAPVGLGLDAFPGSLYGVNVASASLDH